LDGVSSALQNIATTKLDKLPRLADFGLWATAAEQGLGLAAGSVMKAYWNNRNDTSGIVLDNDLARAVLEHGRAGFNGTAVELASQIGWSTTPRDVSEMGKQLRYMAPALEEAGVSVTFTRSNGKRLIVLKGQ
jgi:hypothetical protein